MIVWDDEKHAYIRKVAMINQDGSCYAFQPNGCKETLHLWKHCADIPEELKGNVSKLTSIKDDLGIRLLDPDEWVVPTVELFKDSFK
ncbi:MAG: hypothetical protein HUK21_12485 [Fibrobacteraceae bacterium]|nr:hypothetical protein [Fibrobacteraceae bacterium]